MRCWHPGVRHLAGEHGPRDHADDLAACGQRPVGQQPHQPDLRAAVHDADAARHQPVGQCVHTVAVRRRARRGAQEDRYAHRLI